MLAPPADVYPDTDLKLTDTTAWRRPQTQGIATDSHHEATAECHGAGWLWPCAELVAVGREGIWPGALPVMVAGGLHMERATEM